jgi:chromosome segregation ATPase
METTKVENKVEKNKKVRNTVGIFLTVVMIGLTGFVLYIQNENYQTYETSTDLALNSNVRQSENYRHYVKRYNETRSQLAETQTRLSKMTLELELVSKELESTKSVLSDTQNMLAQAQDENGVLKGDPIAMARLQKIQSSATSNNQAVAKNLENLQKKNDSYNEELSKLRDDLNNSQTNAKDMAEGKAIIKEFKKKIGAVKEKMNALRREARLAKIKAQQEHDRQMAILGNNGYLLKDGQIQMANEAEAAPEKKAVDIDVQFVP